MNKTFFFPLGGKRSSFLAGSKMDTYKRIQLPLLERSGYRGSIEVKIKSNV